MSVLAALPSPAQNVLEIGPLTIHVYGILMAIGIIVAIIVSKKRYVRFGGRGELFESIAIWAVVAGVIGARAGYVVTHTHRFEGRPWAVLFVWEGGLAFYGGILFGALTVVYLTWKRGGDFFAYADAVAIGIPIAQAFGRWGNYFNQELFGTPSNLPWAIIIDPARRPAGLERFETFHPTFLYESMWNALVIVPMVLLLEKTGKPAKGASFGVYLVMYSALRFMVELLRTDTTFRLFGISRNGWVSVAVFIGGLIWIYWMQKRAEERTAVGDPTPLAPSR